MPPLSSGQARCSYPLVTPLMGAPTGADGGVQVANSMQQSFLSPQPSGCAAHVLQEKESSAGNKKKKKKATAVRT